MKEIGIIMSDVHPRKILDGIKTMTRRVIKPQPARDKPVCPYGMWQFHDKNGKYHTIGCPYGQVGDRLWVRETWATSRRLDRFPPSYIGGAGTVALWYAVNDKQIDNPAEVRGRWRSSRYMPRWASRITLKIIEVRVERLQKISHEDAKAEGVIPWSCCLPGAYHYITPFKELWDSLNAKRGYSWESNPWVWVIAFKVIS